MVLHVRLERIGEECTGARWLFKRLGLRLRLRYVEVRVINGRTGQLGEIRCIPRFRLSFNPRLADELFTA